MKRISPLDIVYAFFEFFAIPLSNKIVSSLWFQVCSAAAAFEGTNCCDHAAQTTAGARAATARGVSRRHSPAQCGWRAPCFTLCPCSCGSYCSLFCALLFFPLRNARGSRGGKRRRSRMTLSHRFSFRCCGANRRRKRGRRRAVKKERKEKEEGKDQH